MEINITNHESVSFAESVGISEERSNELSDKMDILTKGYIGNVVRTCDVVNDLANISDNLEEFSYCLINHCNYMMIKHGIFLCPPKKNKPMTKFDINREDFYWGDEPARDERTKDRLTQMAELGMEEVGVAEFGIKGIMSGLYIEKVWRYSDKDFNDYMGWVKSLIK